MSDGKHFEAGGCSINSRRHIKPDVVAHVLSWHESHRGSIHAVFRLHRIYDRN